MNNLDNTKKLVNSSLLVALMVIFSLLGTLPFFSTISLAVSPIIVALIYHKGGKMFTLAGFFVTVVLVSILMNPIYAMTMTILNYCMGVGLIFMIERNVSPLVNFIVLTLAVAVGFAIMTVVDLTLISNMSLMEFLGVIVEEMKLSMNEVVKMYESLGVETEGNEAVAMFQSLSVNTMLTLIPSMLALYSLVAATFIYKVSSAVFKRMGIMVKPFPRLSEIKANMFLIMGTLLIAMAGIGLVYLGVAVGEGIMLMGNNLFSIAGTVGGISLISYYMESKLKYPVFFRVLILIFIATSSLVSIVMIVGIIDSAFDFRKLTENGLFKIIQSKRDDQK